MKKWLCSALSLLLVLAAAVPAFAAQAQSEGLEQAIRKVKSAATIPADYSEFSYSSYQEEQEHGEAVTVWSMDWVKKDGSAGVNATVDQLGNMVTYYAYSDKDEDGLSKVSRADGQKTAEAFLAKAIPDLAKNMKQVSEKKNEAATTRDLTYSYVLYANGIPAPFINAQIGVNKFTGEVEQFVGLNAGQKVPEFPAAESTYSAEEAAKLYSEKLGAELKYYTSFDYKTKKLTVFAGYNMEESSRKVIDAKTGEVVETYAQYKGGDYGVAAKDEGAAGGSRNSASLTPEEQAALDNVSGLIDKERAESILRAKLDLSGQKTNSAYLSKNYIDQDSYYWYINFDKGSGKVDAKTGEILAFNISKEDSNEGAVLSPQQAVQKAEMMAKALAPAKFAKTKLENLGDLTAAYENDKESIYSYRVYYERQENGIGVDGNGISLTVNAQTGEVTSYSCEWYGNAVFPSISDAMDSAAAFALFNKEGKLQLVYVQDIDSKTILAYDFENRVTQYLIDPFSGKMLAQDGTPYHDGLLPEYSDITGHWAESTILALRNNGYYLKGENFTPDKAINQEEFLRYMYGRQGIVMTNADDFYDMLERQKIVTEAEKAPSRNVTRQEAAKFMVRYLGFDSLASRTSIFKDLFKDNVEESYKGYAAICSGLDIMKGDASGRFNGTAAMTRAEAAAALYQLIEAK